MAADNTRAALVGVALSLLVVCSVIPALLPFGGVRAETVMTLADIWVRDSRQPALLLNTVILGAGVALLAGAIGAVFGAVLSRIGLRQATWLRLLLLVPLMLPSYVSALAWMLTVGTSGLLATALVLGLSLYPVSMLAVEAGMRRIPSDLEECARLYAPAPKVWTRVLLPLAFPALGASAVIVFALAIADFVVPSLLRARVYTTEIFTSLAALYDIRRAAVLSLPLMLLAGFTSLAAVALWRGQPLLTTQGETGSERTSPVIQRRAIVALALVAAIGFSLPLYALISRALSGRVPLTSAFDVGAGTNSFVWSASGASIAIAAGVVLAHWRRSLDRGSMLVDVFVCALFAVPATVLGAGTVAFWNRPGWMGSLYRSDVIVLVAYTGRFLPLAILLCGAFLTAVPRSLEEAAAISGAGWLRTMSRVVLPLSAPGLAAGWLILFVLIFGEVALTLLVAPPGQSTIPVRAYTLIANSPTVDVARLALLQIGVTVAPILIAAGLIRRIGIRGA